MALTRKQLALIHVAKAKLGLDDLSYRRALQHFTGKTSAKDLTRAEFDTVMGFFEWSGFAEIEDRGGEQFGERPGMATPKQVDLIRALWFRYAPDKPPSQLDAWLERSFGVTSLRFLDSAGAGKAITALKAMAGRRKPRRAAAGGA